MIGWAMPTKSTPKPLETNATRPRISEQQWSVSRDVLGFQLKLILEGVRDVLMGPATLIAWVLDLARGAKGSDRWFYRLLAMGRRYDRWLNLWGALDHAEERPLRKGDAPKGVDVYLTQVEQAVRKQAEQSGVLESERKQRSSR